MITRSDKIVKPLAGALWDISIEREGTRLIVSAVCDDAQRRMVRCSAAVLLSPSRFAVAMLQQAGYLPRTGTAQDWRQRIVKEMTQARLVPVGRRAAR